MLKISRFAIIAICFFVLFAGCKKTDSDKAADEETQEMKKEMSEAVDATGKYLSEQKQELMAKSGETYEKVKGDTQQLITDIKESGNAKWENLNAEYNLDDKLENARQKLSELKESGEENLQDTKNAFDTAIDELVDAYQKAKAEYQKSEAEN